MNIAFAAGRLIASLSLSLQDCPFYCPYEDFEDFSDFIEGYCSIADLIDADLEEEDPAEDSDPGEESDPEENSDPPEDDDPICEAELRGGSRFYYGRFPPHVWKSRPKWAKKLFRIYD